MSARRTIVLNLGTRAVLFVATCAMAWTASPARAQVPTGPAASDMLVTSTLRAVCRMDARLVAVAEWARAHVTALDQSALRGVAEDAGLSAPTVRVWVGRGDAAAVARTAAGWATRQRPDASTARCAWSRTGNIWSVALVPRWLDPGPQRHVAHVGESARIAAAAHTGIRDVQLVFERPDGRIERASPGRAQDVALDGVGRWTFQLVATDDNGPMPWATWHVDVGVSPPVAALHIASGGTDASPIPPAAPEVGPDPVEDARQVVLAINRSRRIAGRAELRCDLMLQSLADERAYDLARAGVVAHALAPGDAPDARLRAGSVATNRLAENVSRGRDVDDAFRLLVASPSHHAHHIDAAFDAVGVGVARRGETVYLVELFATSPSLRGP